MKAEQLPEETRFKLEKLFNTIRDVLDNQRACPHTRAISYSWKDTEFSTTGGGLVAPSKPQFTYDDKSMHTLHYEILDESYKFLRGIIVHGERPDTTSTWNLRTKLVSVEEQRTLGEARRPIDIEVERELRKLAPPETNFEYLSFGKDESNGPHVMRALKNRRGERLPLNPVLLDLLKRAERVYQASGFSLEQCSWVVRPAGFEFVEYYE